MRVANGKMHGKVYMIICCFYFIVDATNAIDMDYYLGFLRSDDCTNGNAEKDCKSYCKGVPALCHEGECYCHRSVVAVVNINSPNTPESSDELKEKQPETMLTSYGLRPSLRHHIAHFCPDLDKARECIRKCIGTGKPAFCGKDHVCYCGHRYSNHDSQNEKDAMETYKEFKDMYAKYLGVTYPEDSDENLVDETSVEKLKLPKTNKGR